MVDASHKYNIGDTVYVKDNLVVGTRYGGESFVPEMKAFRGKKVKIEVQCSRGEYHIEEDDGSWYFSDEMFADKKPSIFTRFINWIRGKK